MKKIISMFAFAAAIVMGAFTLVSCGDDEDDFTHTGKHHFTFEADLTSSKAEVLADADFQDAAKYVKEALKRRSEQKDLYCTELQATIIFNNFINSDEWTDLVEKVTEAAKACDDPSMTLKLKMIKDGKTVHKEKEWKATFIWLYK